MLRPVISAVSPPEQEVMLTLPYRKTFMQEPHTLEDALVGLKSGRIDLDSATFVLFLAYFHFSKHYFLAKFFSFILPFFNESS